MTSEAPIPRLAFSAEEAAGPIGVSVRSCGRGIGPAASRQPTCASANLCGGELRRSMHGSPLGRPTASSGPR